MIYSIKKLNILLHFYKQIANVNTLHTCIHINILYQYHLLLNIYPVIFHSFLLLIFIIL